MSCTAFKTLAAYLLGLSAFTVQAQPPPIPLHVWKEAGLPYIQNFSPKEYKQSPQNWCIAQDEQGVMYFGNYGVLVYDGASWRHVQTKDTAVRSLCIPPGQNKIYVGAQSDLGYLAPDAIGRLHFVSLLDSIPKAHRNFKDVWRTFAIGDAVYFQTFEYVFRWADGKLSVWTPKHSFHLSFVVNGVFYVRQRQTGLMRMAGDSLQLAPGGERFAQEPILMMLPYEASTILVGTLTQGLFLYDGNSFTPFATKADAFVREHQLYHGAVLPNGLFAIATLRGGVAILDKLGNLCQVLNKASGLRDESVHFTFADRQGTLWLALNNGLAKVETPAPLSRFTAALGVESTVESIIRHQGKLYAATHRGVYVLDEKESCAVLSENASAKKGLSINPDEIPFSKFTPVAEISSPAWALLQAGKHLLAGTNQGVYQIANGHASLIKTKWSNIGVSCLQRSRYDSSLVYVGLFEGLAILQTRNGRWVDRGQIQGVNEWIVGIAEDEDGSLWLGTQYEGVVKVNLTPPLDSTSNTPIEVQIARFGKAHGLPETRISPAVAGGRVLFATQRGLRRFDPAQQLFVPDAALGETFADTSCWIFRIHEDENKNVWIIAGTGHETLNGKAVPQADGQYVWQAIPFSRLNDIGDTFIIYPEKDGVVWFGGSEGIARYTPDIPKDYAVDYPTLIRRVAGISTDSVFYHGAAAQSFQPVFEYKNNSLRFEFAAPSYDEVSANQYQLMLEGFDDDWSNWTTENRKDYTGLSEGEYVFKVRAKNVYHHIGDEARFAFTILPPWYRSRWAYTGYLLLFVTAAFGVDRVQRARLIQRELERAKLREAEITRQKNIELQEKNAQLERVLHELKAAQALLARSESRFRSVAQSANDAIVTANSTGRITFWNKRAEAMFGYSEQEALGQPLTILMPERYREMHRQGMDRFLLTGQPRIIGQVVEIHAARKDGVEFPIELTVASWQVDDGKFVTGIIRDITKRKQAQAELEKTQALLEAENQRKSEELEKARQLQLSMLPNEIPQLPHIEIDAYMKTATEVGGDYYDFQVGKDGGLTVVIGDATGHGINAGMMVTATKSLLTNLAHEPDLVKIFKQLNGALKRVNLHRHYMALQMIKMKDHRLEVCAAGMPPLLIYRAAERSMEEVTLKAMPLGSVSEYPYQKREVALSPGDTIMLMSDGFPELFNERSEIFDYDRVKTAFAEVAPHSPRQIIEHFVRLGETWANGKGQQDDMTFIVLKVK
jgi:PAS domain S-box-containing protein